MQHCALILADHYPEPASATLTSVWPRLPALEYWLARATSVALGSGDWRNWLARRAGGAALANAAPGGVVAAVANTEAASGSVPARHHWLATPVHWVAGLDTVRLHPAGLLSLSQIEQSLLVADFARVFADSGWALIATGGRELLLSGPLLPDTQTDDPARWLGMSPKSGMARGPGASALRLLGTEIEMWLHEHVVNRARTAAGQLSVSGLWLWGGGASFHGTVACEGTLYADDPYARAVWQLGGSVAVSLPSSWAALQTASAPQQDSIVVLPLSGNSDGDGAGFERLERNWIQPLLADWRGGSVSVLTLVAGARQWTLTRAARWRLWRRSRPWWQSLPC
jgi:hypothetical protein